MPTSCSAYACTNRSSKGGGISFFKFPLSNAKLTHKWVIFMKRDQFVPNKSSRICSTHFQEKYLKDNNGRKYLLPNAVPSIFNFPAYLLPKHIAERKPPTRRRSNMKKTAGTTVELDKVADIVQPVEFHTKGDMHSVPNAVSADHSYCLPSPRKLKRTVSLLEDRCSSLEKKLKLSNQTIKRVKSRNASLSRVLAGLKSRLCEAGSSITEHHFKGVMKDLLENDMKGFKSNVYPESVKQFSLTLHFYSARAYSFLRKFVKLPHPRTIRHWATAVDGSPGFTQESFEKIKSEVQNSSTPIFVCLMVDEMAIKKQVDWDGKKVVGYCSLTSECLDFEEVPLAKEALVFLVTALNRSWKLPVGYSLINGLNADVRVNLIRQYVRKLSDAGVKVVAITCDGASSNKSMLIKLEVDVDNNKSWFPHPTDPNLKVYCLLDACHMLKLMRNCIAEKQCLFINGNKESPVLWKYFQLLEELQSVEGLHAANKLKRQHIDWHRQKMKVSLAAETLSNSVGNAMLFCRNLGVESFQGCAGTVEFIKKVDAIFDLLNFCHPCGRGMKAPIRSSNQSAIMKFISDSISFLKSLVLPDGTMVINSSRKVPVYGLILDLMSIEGLANDYVWGDNCAMPYLLTRRLSQDHLELFFSAIRNRGGNNNNPTALQFKSAYRKCLIARIDPSCRGNCGEWETSKILLLEGGFQQSTSNDEATLIGQDDIPRYESLSMYCDSVVEYIAGNVVFAVSKRIKCADCLDCLFPTNAVSCCLLTNLKNMNNSLCKASKDVITVCKNAETVFRSFRDSLVKMQNVLLKLKMETMRWLNGNIFLSFPHLFDANDVDEVPHFTVIMNLLLNHYFKIRLHHLCRRVSERERGLVVRQIYTKLIIFKGQ